MHLCLYVLEAGGRSGRQMYCVRIIMSYAEINASPKRCEIEKFRSSFQNAPTVKVRAVLDSKVWSLNLGAYCLRVCRADSLFDLDARLACICVYKRASACNWLFVSAGGRSQSTLSFGTSQLFVFFRFLSWKKCYQQTDRYTDLPTNRPSNQPSNWRSNRLVELRFS